MTSLALADRETDSNVSVRPPSDPRRTAIVIGAGLGGLSAAIHLRMAGWHVRLLEANATVGGRANIIERDGFRFDAGPSLLNYPWVFEDLFRAAGRRLEDYVRLLPVDPSVAFQWPDGVHLSLSSDLTRLIAEFERVEPGSRAGTLAYMRDAAVKYRLAFDRLVTTNETRPFAWLQSVGLKNLPRLSLQRSMDADLRRYFRGDRIADALGSYAMYLGGSPYDLPGFFSMLPYGELSCGLWLPEGGIYGLVAGMERLAREVGVQVETDRPVAEIIVRNGVAAGIRCADGEELDARVIVSNVDVETTNRRLLGEGGGGQATPKMTPGVITFYWGVRGRVEDAGHHTIFLTKNVQDTFRQLLRERRMPDELAFYVSVPSATDPSLAPAGHSAVFVLVPTPTLSQMPGVDWTALVDNVRARVFERLRQHGLSLTPDRVLFEECWTPVEWERRFGLFDGSAFGAAHTLFQLGPWRASNYHRQIGGLFYTGASTTPGTGLPMVVLSGRMTAERVRERCGVPA
jgi:phytoene desaturase